MIYEENRIDEETISLEGASVVIAEGVYTSLCSHVDCRVSIHLKTGSKPSSTA